MFIDMFIFALMAYAYVPREVIKAKMDEPSPATQDDMDMSMKNSTKAISNGNPHNNDGYDDEPL